MKPIATSEIKLLQLNILKSVHNFCIDNNIRYSAAFGTLLGTIRHQGYIPWDDDIDIMIPRLDYERFISSFSDENYRVASNTSMASYYLPYAKVYDVRTKVNEHVEIPMDFGVNIDVFPLDVVPDSDKELASLLKVKDFWNKIYNLKIVSVEKSRSWYKNVVLLIAHVLLAPWSIHIISEKLRSCAVRYSGMTTSRVGLVAQSDNNNREIWPLSVFAKYETRRFEDTEILVISDYDHILKSIYGDYMQLPPVEKRITHHSFDAWWK